MGDWGTKPWENDVAADWFMYMMETTQLAEYVEKTLRQEIDDDDPAARAAEIRAAASVLVLLGHAHIWPVDDWENDLKLAISRLEEILPRDFSDREEEQIRAEITVLKARLERKTGKHIEKTKWWHFDE